MQPFFLYKRALLGIAVFSFFCKFVRRYAWPKCIVPDLSNILQPLTALLKRLSKRPNLGCRLGIRRAVGEGGPQCRECFAPHQLQSPPHVVRACSSPVAYALPKWVMMLLSQAEYQQTALARFYAWQKMHGFHKGLLVGVEVWWTLS